MSIYQRYLSKSLIFFSSIFIVFLLLMESNIGFKWIFNFTNYFFLGLKTEEISGNWRDFTLKNINYQNSKISIQANSIHLILDVQSLFKISTVFKQLDIHNAVILLKREKKSSDSRIYKTSLNTIKKNIFITHPIIFQKIHVNKIVFKTPCKEIFLLNVFSGIKLINHTIKFYPTCIDIINIVSPNISLKKNIKKNDFLTINSVYNSKKIKNFLHFLSTQSNIFIPLNINFTFVKCRNVNLIDNKKTGLVTIEWIAKVNNNTLNIKKIKIYSTLFNMKSHGKIIFHHRTIFFNIKNKISIPNFFNKMIVFSFKGRLNNKFVFQLISDDIYKINIYGLILLNNFNHPFNISVKSNDFLVSIKKQSILKIKKFNIFVKGELNHYLFSLKQVLSIHSMPSMFIYVNGHGNLENIFLKKIKFSLLQKIKNNNKKMPFKKRILCIPSILKLMGKINIISKYRNNKRNFYIPKIRIHSQIMRKKISVLGSLRYKNFNILKSSGIKALIGKNKLYLKGILGKKINVRSSLYADDLDYFLPNLTGIIKAKSNFYGNYFFPNMKNKIFVRNLHWQDIYLKSIKILANMNVKNKFSGNFLFNMKKAHFFRIHIDSLYINANWSNKHQKFYFLFKSPILYINIILNNIVNKKTGNWNRFVKKINVKTVWGEFVAKKIPVFYHLHLNNNINDFYEKKTQIISIIPSFARKLKKSIFNIFNQSRMNFKSELFFRAKLHWMLEKNIFNGKIVLKSNNIQLERRKKETVSFEYIDFLNLSAHLINNDLRSEWIIKKSITSLENQKIFGKLNILDIYDQKKITGECIIVNFPLSFINFFTSTFREVKGIFNSNVKFFGSIYQPEVSANVHLKNVFIKSDNILKYITLFFPYFTGKMDNIKINQEIIIKKGSLVFKLNECSSDLKNIAWNLFFNSKKIEIVVLPKIKVKFSSHLNLYYLFKKYNLIGYIKFSFFYFKINEKNFII